MQIIRGVMPKPKKVVIYGPEGIGKSTLASRFPDPLFIDTEGSTSHMDVARLPSPSSWTMLLQTVEDVKREPDCCKTLVIDTADWAEKLCIEHVCTSRKVSGIEDFGYGKGYTYEKEEFGKLLNLLTDIIDKGINVVITAHAMMRKFEQPDEMGAYDRWELKLSKQCAPLVKEWADIILFCNYKTMVVNVDNKGAQKGKNKAQGGRRVMYTTHHPCWDAKNRFGLADELPMDYQEIQHVIGEAAVPAPAAPMPEAADAPYRQMDMSAIGAEPAPEPERKRPAPPAPAPEEILMPDKSQEKEAPQSSAVSHYVSDPEKLPKALRDLMEKDNIAEWSIQDVIGIKGYYPSDTLIQDMDPEFINGWIIAFWPKLVEMIREAQEQGGIPFN